MLQCTVRRCSDLFPLHCRALYTCFLRSLITGLPQGLPYMPSNSVHMGFVRLLLFPAFALAFEGTRPCRAAAGGVVFAPTSSAGSDDDAGIHGCCGCAASGPSDIGFVCTPRSQDCARSGQRHISWLRRYARAHEEGAAEWAASHGKVSDRQE